MMMITNYDAATDEQRTIRDYAGICSSANEFVLLLSLVDAGCAGNECKTAWYKSR